MIGAIIGGAPVLTLRAPEARGARLTAAEIVPGRAMMLLQLRADVPGLGEIEMVTAPPAHEAAQRLSGDFAGSASYAFGGAILAPYANRIRGRVDGRDIVTEVHGRSVRLPANHGGQAPGAERYAMHGLILDTPAQDLRQTDHSVIGRVRGAFAGRWPSDFDFDIAWTLDASALSLEVTAINAGDTTAPVGLGWHPYFNLPSGDRTQARLEIPAEKRVVVNDYDEVLPTGEIASVAGTRYDFRGGRALGDLYLDDCFTGLQPGPGSVLISDPAADYAVRVSWTSPEITAVQTYAPPDKSFVVVEPQFNLANPFGDEMARLDTGMVPVEPGGSVRYAAAIELVV